MDIKSKVLEELDKWLIAQRWNKGQDILQPIKEKTIDLTEKLTREEKIDRIEKAIIFSAVGQGIIETERNRFMEIIDDFEIKINQQVGTGKITGKEGLEIRRYLQELKSKTGESKCTN